MGVMKRPRRVTPKEAARIEEARSLAERRYGLRNKAILLSLARGEQVAAVARRWHLSQSLIRKIRHNYNLDGTKKRC